MDRRRELLELLLENARYSTDDLARLSGLAPEEVTETIESLEAEGVIRGYQAIVDWEQTDAERARAAVELNVTLDRETGYDDIAARIARFPEVSSLQLVSGNYDFLVEIEADTIREISQFVSEKIAPIPEITQTVTHFVMETYKERGVEMDDGFDEDDRLSVSP